MVVTGEYMNKSKKDGNGKTFDGCLVLFDILVHKGQYLTGTSFLERAELLDSLFPGVEHDGYIYKVSENIYRVKNFTTNLKAVYDEISRIDMYEGLVCKKPTGILEDGLRAANNVGWQIKARKETKNYTY
jgi:ATP-dependent DNA ligase